MFTLTKEDVLRKMRQANTLEKIAEANEVVDQWLSEHPDDMEVRMQAEGLAMMESALREIAKKKSGEAA